MKVTLKDAIKFDEVYPLIKSTPMPIKVAYGLAKVYEEVEKEKSHYREVYSGIIDKYAQKDKKGNIKTQNDGADILIKPDCIESVRKEFEELDSYEINIPVDKFPLSAFDDLTLSPDSISALMPFINEGE